MMTTKYTARAMASYQEQKMNCFKEKPVFGEIWWVQVWTRWVWSDNQWSNWIPMDETETADI